MQKPKISKPNPDSKINNLSKKLSEALENPLKDDPIISHYLKDTDSESWDQKSSISDKSQQIIAKAKSLLEKRVLVPKNDAFLTAIHVFSEEKKLENSAAPESPRLNEIDMLKDLILDEAQPKDDLVELRKMINRTKKNISDYAFDLYNLKQSVDEVQKEYKDLGYKANNPDLMDNMDKAYEKYMPKGDRRKLFEYEFYENPNKIRDVNKKKGMEIGKNSFMKKKGK